MVKIKGLQKTSLIDYPGKVSAVIFLGGCNFRCPYCQNPDLVLEPEKQPTISEEDFFAFLEERKKWIDGVCIGGGEPTIHKDLPEFIGKIKGMGFLVKLDTNGTNPGMLKGLLGKGLVDCVAMDIKGPPEKYKEAAKAGVDVEKIKESVALIRNSGINHEFRSTIMPALHKREDVLKMASWLKGNGVFYLQGFRNSSTLDPAFRKEKGFSREEMEELRKACGKYVKTRLRV